jgi:NTE family protein
MIAPKLGLALGSGSARGWAHIGVLHALAERGLKPAVTAGASVGALVGAAYASGRLAALEEWICTLTQTDVWRLVDATFLNGGVMSGNRLMTAVSRRIGDAPIEELAVAFGAVATDLYTGEEVWLRSGPVMQAVRASSGLPGLFTPMWHENRWLIDGGVVNPVPVSLCRALGAELVIAVDLSRPVTRATPRPGGDSAASAAPAPATEEGGAILKRWSGLVDGLVESFRSRQHEPGLFEVMANSINIMQDRITRSRFELEPAELVLHPELADFQLLDFHRAREAIAAGRACVEQADAVLRPLLRRD